MTQRYRALEIEQLMPRKRIKTTVHTLSTGVGLALTLALLALVFFRTDSIQKASAAAADRVKTIPIETDGFNQLALALPAKTQPDPFAEKVFPLLTKYCIICHNDKKEAGGLSLEGFKTEVTALKERKLWETARQMLTSKEMPPKGKAQPDASERKTVLEWIESGLARVNCGQDKDPGRPTIRRLNRAEYNNTIRDLVGVNFQPADDFPSDDVGYGFDNIGDVLSMPPILLEKYMAAAEKILDQAIVVVKPIVAGKDTFRPQNFRTSGIPRIREPGKRYPLLTNGKVFVNFDFLHGGEYIIRARAYGEQAGKELPRLGIQVDNKTIKDFEVDALEAKANIFETRTKITAGRHDVELAFMNEFEDKPAKKGRHLFIELLEIEGPFNPIPDQLPKSHQRIMIAKPTSPADKDKAALKIIENFATKAYRRPVRAEESNRLLKLFKMANDQGEPFEKSVALALRAVLVSPNFLFRIEKDADPNNPRKVHPVSGYELATRLSYFLWSSMPDDELFALAGQGELHKPAVVEQQVKRMLADPKATALTENFAGQWLQLRTIATLAPDSKTYPNFDPALKSAMVRETELFFENIVKEDRSILEFLDSDYSFLNARLAKHYGVKGVNGKDFQRVTLTDKNRGGILTQASILTLTSNPTRTSPVKRGKWILENILGTPPPPPPPDVPELKEEKQEVLKGSLRQRMEQHRSNPACATCHQKMDPLGFGMENFDGIGGWRTLDGKFKIDSSGTLPGGEKFDGPGELRKILLGKSDLFRRNLTEKLLTYALGRGLEYYDKCALDDIVKKLKAQNDNFSTLVTAIALSEPFQKRRGGSRE